VADHEELWKMGTTALANQPFSALLGTTLVDIGPGQAVLGLAVTGSLSQQNGYVHGGVLSYLADNALAFAGGSVLGPGVVTAGFTIDYLRAAVGRRILARARSVHAGRRHAVCVCEIWDVDERGAETLCALAQGTIKGRAS
jgi:uncharacterized protein (TIGR00369 family)